MISGVSGTAQKGRAESVWATAIFSVCDGGVVLRTANHALSSCWPAWDNCRLKKLLTASLRGLTASERCSAGACSQAISKRLSRLPSSSRCDCAEAVGVSVASSMQQQAVSSAFRRGDAVRCLGAGMGRLRIRGGAESGA